MATTSGQTKPLAIDFITEALAAAEGNQYTPAKYEAAIELLATAAKHDPEIELVIGLCKKGQLGLVGVVNGEVSQPHMIVRFLMRALGM